MIIEVNTDIFVSNPPIIFIKLQILYIYELILIKIGMALQETTTDFLILPGGQFHPLSEHKHKVLLHDCPQKGLQNSGPHNTFANTNSVSYSYFHYFNKLIVHGLNYSSFSITIR